MARDICTINQDYFQKVYGTTNLYRVRQRTEFWSSYRTWLSSWKPPDYTLEKGEYFILLGGRSAYWHIIVNSKNCEGLKLYVKCNPYRFR